MGTDHEVWNCITLLISCWQSCTVRTIRRSYGPRSALLRNWIFLDPRSWVELMFDLVTRRAARPFLRVMKTTAIADKRIPLTSVLRIIRSLS